eukprot:5006936-Lingulodinium_polyedra.AAC.1
MFHISAQLPSKHRWHNIGHAHRPSHNTAASNQLLRSLLAAFIALLGGFISLALGQWLGAHLRRRQNQKKRK